MKTAFVYQNPFISSPIIHLETPEINLSPGLPTCNSGTFITFKTLKDMYFKILVFVFVFFTLIIW